VPRAAAISDAELITRTGSGDRHAFEVLYRRHSRAVFGLALRRLGDSRRAEDAVEDTFASVWRSAATYKPERALGSTWLYAVAGNAILDRGSAAGETAVVDEPEAESPEIGPDALAEHGWVSARVHLAIAALPDEQRQVIELLYWNGLSQNEVATVTGAPLGTVKTRTRGALRQLAGLLEELA